jgi:broad specificity phosphatase PhoE
MAKQTILIIRHAEKPESDAKTGDGVDADGALDPKSLTPRGWLRAGLWTELFAPSLGKTPVLPQPTAIFASRPARHTEAAGKVGSKSRRPLETVSPLGAKLGVKVDIRFGKGEEDDLTTEIASIRGVVLVCWQHEKIADIGKALAPDLKRIPTNWPKHCFNLIFRFDRAGRASPWVFEQVVPFMLKGDRSNKL